MSDKNTGEQRSSRARIPEYKLERLKELGRSGKVTPTQIAARLGMSESYVRRVLKKAGIEPVPERNR